MQYKKVLNNYWRQGIVATLILSNIFVWLAVLDRRTDTFMRVYFLDVGQGDAILIESPNRGRVLVDGGRNRQVLSELDKILPFADRRIDVLVGTHPDADHVGGFPEIISRYKVGLFIWPGVKTDKSFDRELWKRLEEKEIPNFIAERGMVINFRDGAKLVILFPNQDVSKWNENDASIVAKLVYGEQSFLLTGDSPVKVENILMNLDEGILKSDVLKAGHHGSRTSTGISFAEAVSPEYAVISAGKDNSYGHPHQEILDILAKVGAEIVSTVEIGTIRFETDGNILRIK